MLKGGNLMNHQQIDLSIKEIKILKYYLKNPNSPIAHHSVKDIEKLISLELLTIPNQIEIDIDTYINAFGHRSYDIQPQIFSLTQKGEMYLQFLRKDILRFYIPLAISIFALIISVVALIKSW